MALTSDNPRSPVEAAERDKIDRKVLLWLNAFPELPVPSVRTEAHLEPDKPGIALSRMTSAYINKSYILGGYEAEYQFRVIYRVKNEGSVDKSLKADELLNRLGEWCGQHKPDLGEGIQVLRSAPVSQAESYGLWPNGDEDHIILIKLTYEVI